MSASERAEGYHFGGEWVSFGRTWAGHRFTDDEVDLLLDGGEVEVLDAVSKDGLPCPAAGRLERSVWKGHTVWSFQPVRWLGERPLPRSWASHKFTPEERETLASGGVVHVRRAKAAFGGRQFECDVRFSPEEGVVPSFDEERF